MRGLRTQGRLFFAVHFPAGGKVALIGGQRFFVQNFHAVDVGGEGGVAAVIGPVGVHHAHFGDGGIALFLVAEMGLQELEVIEVHGEAELIEQGGKTGFVERGEAFHGAHAGGHFVFHAQGFHGIKAGFARFHGVDEVALDLFHVGFGEIAGEQEHARRAHGGAFAPGHELDALTRGIGPLIELTGQVFHGKGGVVAFGQGFAGVVHLRFGKHGFHRALKHVFVQTFHVVAVDEPQTGQGRDAEQGAEFSENRSGLVSEGGLFLYINASYHS